MLEKWKTREKSSQTRKNYILFLKRSRRETRGNKSENIDFHGSGYVGEPQADFVADDETFRGLGRRGSFRTGDILCIVSEVDIDFIISFIILFHLKNVITFDKKFLLTFRKFCNLQGNNLSGCTQKVLTLLADLDLCCEIWQKFRYILPI